MIDPLYLGKLSTKKGYILDLCQIPKYSSAQLVAMYLIIYLFLNICCQITLGLSLNSASNNMQIKAKYLISITLNIIIKNLRFSDDFEGSRS